MKLFTASAAGAFLLSLAALPAAQAQTACAQTSTIGYRADAGTASVEKRTATETQYATSFTYGSYTTGVAGSTATAGTANDVFQLTSSYSAQVDGRALIWRENNTATTLPTGTASSEVNTATPLKAKVLLTFNREVSNLTLVLQDIDRGTLAGGGGSDYTDEVDFYPTNAAGTATDISSTGAVTTAFGATAASASSTTCAYLAPFALDGYTQVAVRGTGLNGTTTAPSRNGNVTITFANPVKSILLTFRNLNTLASSQLRLQTIGIEQLSWCSQADLTTTIANASGSTPAGGTGKFNVSFSNVGDLSTGTVTAKVQLNKNLANVVATNGGTYDPTTGIVTYSASSAALIAAYQGLLNSVISYTMPAAGTVVTAASSVSSPTSEGLNPNANSASATVTAAAPLPVTLTAFDAQAVGSSVQLTWATASETNNSYFGIERSTDGTTFAQVTQVAGQGTTAAASRYAYLDASAPRGTVYYRLRQVDTDGTATYSPVRTVSLAAANLATLSVYPNPATAAAVTLDLHTLPEGSYQVSLLNAQGSTVAHYAAQGAGSQPLALPTALPAGTYIVLVQGQGLHLTQRLARQ